LLSSLLSSSVALADTVVLKNGDRISGEVVRMEDSSLLVKTSALGDVKVKWAAVAEVTSEKPMHVMAGMQQVAAEAIVSADNSYRLLNAGNALVIPADSLKTVRSELDQKTYAERLARQNNPRFVDLWTASADAGLSGARGTNDTTNMSLGVKGARTTNHTRLSMFFNSLFARSSTNGQQAVTSANSLRGGARYEVNVSDRIFTFGFANAETDSVQHLDIRDVFGGGAGIRLAQNKSTTFDLFSGASLNQESFSTSSTPDRTSGELLFGQDSSYKLFERATVGTRLSFYPNMTVPGEYRAQLDATATTKLNHWLGWQFTVSNLYVSNPAVGARNNELLLSTGIRFILGKERPFKPQATVMKFGRQMGY
jgi:putative salt-induced outer membrane protein YdiY